ncbi:MAG: shikimate kinase [Pyrinomonadaceae bacterium]
MVFKLILIGPIRTGKSTVGKLLAERLNLPQRSLDIIFDSYLDGIGYDRKYAAELKKIGFYELTKYWKPFEPYGVEQIVSEPEAAVIDLGGGHSTYEDETLFTRVKKALLPFPNVFLIMPSPDLNESIAILNERTNGFVSNGFDFHDNFVRSHCNYELAKQTVYTKGKTPEETCEEIEKLLVYE